MGSPIQKARGSPKGRTEKLRNEHAMWVIRAQWEQIGRPTSTPIGPDSRGLIYF